MEQVKQQFGTQNLTWRLLRAFAGSLAAITALGHFPGYDTEAAAWTPIGESLFEWVGIIGVFVIGTLTGNGVKK